MTDSLRELTRKAHEAAKVSGWYDPRKLTVDELRRLRIDHDVELNIGSFTDDEWNTLFAAFQSIQPRNFLEIMFLIMSEIVEAGEEYRHGKATDEVYLGDGGKPEGIGVELADAIIRICDTAGAHGIDLPYLIAMKMKFNETRGYRHGGKRA